MIVNDTVLKGFFAAIATGITAIFGGFDTLLYYLFIFLVADYITGLLCAVYRKEVSSSIGLNGIIKKVMQLFLVVVASVVDNVGGMTQPIFRTLVIYFLLANEGISILENVAGAGVPVPDFLREALTKIKNKQE